MATFPLGSWAGRRFLAIQACAVPRSRAFSDAQREEGLRLVNHLLEDQPAGVHRKLIALLALIELLAWLTGGCGFPELDGARQTRVLGLLFDAPVPLLRKGFWGLNTLVKLSVFGQPSVYPDIRYQREAMPHV